MALKALQVAQTVGREAVIAQALVRLEDPRANVTLKRLDITSHAYAMDSGHVNLKVLLHRTHLGADVTLKHFAVADTVNAPQVRLESLAVAERFRADFALKLLAQNMYN